MPEQVRYYARVTGRVQGVGFRYFTRRKADELGLSGYVRNRHDGDVELEVQGPEDSVKRLLSAVGSGPSLGYVSCVVTAPRPTEPEAAGFDIRF